MAATTKVVRVFIVSYHADFHKEREILFKEVLPDLRAWCESRRLQLIETDVRWGGFMPSDVVQEIDRLTSSCYFEDEMPYFINFTCDNLGLVPAWGQAPEPVLADIQRRLRISEEELGILYRAYREDNHNGLVLVRDDGFLDDLLPEERRTFVRPDLIPNKHQHYCLTKLQAYPCDRVFHYKVDCDGLEEETSRLLVQLESSLPAKILDFLKAQIATEHLYEAVFSDIYTETKEAHEAFVRLRSPNVKGREEPVAEIEAYVRSGGKDVPLLVLGGAGSGKSSLMAKAVDHILHRVENKEIPSSHDEGWHVFYHFVGAVPGSTELELMLRRLLRELGVINDTCLPRDVEAAAQMCCSALASTATPPAIIFVDGVNQFDEDTDALIMSWVARKLAPQIRCVLSMINDTRQHQTLMARESKPQQLHMLPLDFDARQQIVQEYLSKYNQSLSRDQMNTLLANRASENPLWLTVACEELRLVQDPRKLHQRIGSLPDGLLDLLEEVLTRLESETGGPLLTATLCLLEVSAAGLLETELLQILAKERDLMPPSPYEEKDEKESSEKESGEKQTAVSAATEEKWLQVFRALRPFLRAYGDSREGRLDFYHRAVSKAVRRMYFKQCRDNENPEESSDLYAFWHQKLADFFEDSGSIGRKVEEYLYHLTKIDDKTRLAQCLVDWQVFDKLYSDEYSSQLLAYWRKTGGSEVMLQCYKEAIGNLENMEPRDERLIPLRYEHVARIFLQAGKYVESLELAKVALKWEEKELGNRPERMVELYSLMAEIYDEKLKLNDFVSRSQLPDLRKTIGYGKKSIALREAFSGDYHKFKSGMSLMKLAFSLESWQACGGEPLTMTGTEAIEEGNRHIDSALEVFQQLRDTGHYAEALMTKGVLATRGSMEQLKYYDQAMEICRQAYGEDSLLSSRLYINIGIVYEDNNDYVKAYTYFRKWAQVSEIVLGPDHPKTLRAKGVLQEPRYRLVARRLKEHEDQQVSNDNHDNHDDNQDIDESTINREVEDLDEEEDGYYDGAVSAQVQDNVEEDEYDNDNEEERQDGQEDSDQPVGVDDAAEMVQRLVSEIWHRMTDSNDWEFVDGVVSSDIGEQAGDRSTSGSANGEQQQDVGDRQSAADMADGWLRDNDAESSEFRELRDSRVHALANGPLQLCHTDNRLSEADAPESAAGNETHQSSSQRLQIESETRLSNSGPEQSSRDNDATPPNIRQVLRDNDQFLASIMQALRDNARVDSEQSSGEESSPSLPSVRQALRDYAPLDLQQSSRDNNHSSASVRDNRAVEHEQRGRDPIDSLASVRQALREIRSFELGQTGGYSSASPAGSEAPAVAGQAPQADGALDAASRNNEAPASVVREASRDNRTLESEQSGRDNNEALASASLISGRQVPRDNRAVEHEQSSRDNNESLASARHAQRDNDTVNRALDPSLSIRDNRALDPSLYIRDNRALDPSLSIRDNRALDPSLSIRDNRALDPSLSIRDNRALDPSLSIRDNRAPDPSLSIRDNRALDPSLSIRDNRAPDPSLSIRDNRAPDPSLSIRDNMALDPSLSIRDNMALEPGVSSRDNRALEPGVSSRDNRALEPGVSNRDNRAPEPRESSGDNRALDRAVSNIDNRAMDPAVSNRDNRALDPAVSSRDNRVLEPGVSRALAVSSRDNTSPEPADSNGDNSTLDPNLVELRHLAAELQLLQNNLRYSIQGNEPTDDAS